MKLFKGLFIVGIVILFCSFGYGQNQIDYIGSTLWSGINDIVVEGNYAYCAMVNGLQVFDISQDDTIRLVSQIKCPGLATSVSIKDNILIIAGGYYYSPGFYEIYDIANPEVPFKLASNNSSIYYVFDTAIKDSLLFLGEGYYIVPGQPQNRFYFGHLDIFNIADPSNPIQINGPRTEMGYGQFCKFSYKDTILYISGNTFGGIYLVNFANPAIPAFLPQGNFFATEAANCISSEYLFGSRDGWLSSYNLVDASNPLFTDSFYFGSTAYDLTANQNMIFASCETSGLSIFDISDPDSISMFSTIDDIDLSTASSSSGSYLFAADYWKGLKKIELSNPRQPLIIDEYATASYIAGYSIFDNYFYIADRQFGLRIMDISNVDQPLNIFNLQLAHGANNIQISGNYCFITDTVGCLTILNISDPETPVIESRLDLIGPPTAMHIYGNYLLITADSGLYIIDIINIRAPHQVGSYIFSYFALDVDVEGQYAFVAAGTLNILDISYPYSPVFVSASNILSNVQNVRVSNNYAYIINGEYSQYYPFQPINVLRIADVTDKIYPDTLQYRSTITIRSPIRNMTLTAERLFLPIGRNKPGELKIFDLTNPAQPSMLNDILTPGSPNQATYWNNLIAIADGNSLIFFRAGQTNIQDKGLSIPYSFSLFPNYPNPFNSSTVIRYNLPNAAEVTLDIYDILGRRVQRLVEGLQPAGYNQATWDAGRNSSGIYFYKIQTGDLVETRKMILVK